MERLAPSVRAFAAAAAAGPTLADLPLTEAREAVLGMASQFGAGDAVAAVDDFTIETAHGQLAMRCYRPFEPKALPPLLWLHGGGWATGDLGTSDALCRRLCARIGVAVAAVDYRLAPEHPFPAAIDDVGAAATWLGDPENGLADERGIYVGGDSAGGNLAASYAVNRPEVRVAAQLLAFPALDLRGGYSSETEFAEGFFTTTDELRTWIGHYLGDRDASDPRVSPLSGIHAEVPPALVVTAECDPLRDSAEEFVNQLRAVGVQVRMHRFVGMVHDFVLFGDLLPESDPGLDLIAGAFLELVGGNGN